MNTKQQALVSAWFTRLDQGMIEDTMTKQIAQVVDYHGGFRRLTHWMTLPSVLPGTESMQAEAGNVVQRAGQWVTDALGSISLALGSLLNSGVPRLVWNTRASQAHASEVLLTHSEIVSASDSAQRQIELSITKVDDQYCRVDIGVYPSDDTITLDGVKAALKIGDSVRETATNIFGKAMFEGVPLDSIDQVVLSVGP